MTINIRSGGAVTTAVIGSGNEEFNDESSEEGFRDAAELRQAFRDPRYQTSAWFRARVQEAVAAGTTIKDAAPGASALDGGKLTGRYQVRGNPMDEAPPAERQLTEHEKAMIAKATAHGL
ncbi:hypothetical protein IVB15_26505 [Bradyrhizobium sp. 182]|uniref:capsid assembly protein n=1 Tax=Bradyrhizobium sp. 182 TaxID=2782651 RepID=UPI001FFB098C|nr:hypothetical protein [Bradyrhizobium sp. 182]MCK1531162.1 hypothetical protein [Bradyrhizobium sp. 182]